MNDIIATLENKVSDEAIEQGYSGHWFDRDECRAILAALTIKPVIYVVVHGVSDHTRLPPRSTIFDYPYVECSTLEDAHEHKTEDDSIYAVYAVQEAK